MPQGLRRRLDQSPLLAGAGGAAIAAWTRTCNATTRWQTQGEAGVAAAAAQGPVLMVMWHEMVMMGSIHWRKGWGELVSLHDLSPAGRMAAAAQRRLGTRPVMMSSKQSNLGMTRDILALIRDGSSLGITGDGPRGPRRVLKDAPLDWARAAGVPVFAYGWAIAGQRRAQSWDKMILARPFARGAMVFARWEAEVPRRMDAATRENLRADLTAHLTATAEAAEALAMAG